MGHACEARPPCLPAGPGAESRCPTLPCADDIELDFSPAMIGEKAWRLDIAKHPAATMRRIYRGPSPSWESHGYVGQLQYPEEIAETLPGVPDVRTRLQVPEGPDRIAVRRRPCSAPAPVGGLTSPLEGPGFTRRQWRGRLSEEG